MGLIFRKQGRPARFVKISCLRYSIVKIKRVDVFLRVAHRLSTSECVCLCVCVCCVPVRGFVCVRVRHGPFADNGSSHLTLTPHFGRRVTSLLETRDPHSRIFHVLSTCGGTTNLNHCDKFVRSSKISLSFTMAQCFHV